MALATSAAIALAGVGAAAAVQGVQMGVSARGQKISDKAAAAAMDKKTQLIEQGVVNQYSGLQAPTEAFDLAEEQTQRAVTEATVAAQEAGAEGVIGGVGNIIQAQQQAGLQTAAQRAQAEFDVEKLKAGEQARIDQMKYQGLVGLSDQELTGAQEASAYHREMFGKGLEGLSASFGQAAGIFGDSMSNDNDKA